MKKNKIAEKSVSENPFTLEIRRGNKIRRMEFASMEDMLGWQKAYRKSKLYIPYFLVGIAINFVLFFAGLDLANNLFLGPLVGLAVPLACMYILAEFHHRVFYEKKDDVDNAEEVNPSL